MATVLELLVHFLLGPLGVLWAYLEFGLPVPIGDGGVFARWLSSTLGTVVWFVVAGIRR